MKVKLFTPDTEEYNELGMEYEKKVNAVLRPIFDEAFEKGINMRELSNVVLNSSFDLTTLKIYCP